MHAHLRPPFRAARCALAGGELDELALVADKNPPELRSRTRAGEDRQSIDKHPAYRRLEEVAFSEYGLAAMSHRAGVLGWPRPLPPIAKYALSYLYVQAEFGVCCPLSMTDALARTLSRFGDASLVARYLPGLLSQDMDSLTQGAMFMTEQGAGSDVGARRRARCAMTGWRLSGQMVCYNAERDRPCSPDDGAEAGTSGLSFSFSEDARRRRANAIACPPQGELGTRDMASG